MRDRMPKPNQSGDSGLLYGSKSLAEKSERVGVNGIFKPTEPPLFHRQGRRRAAKIKSLLSL